MFNFKTAEQALVVTYLALNGTRWQSADFGPLHDKHVISLWLNKSTTWIEILFELLDWKTKLVSRITIDWKKKNQGWEEEDKICLPCLERPNLSHRHGFIQEEDYLANHTFTTESVEKNHWSYYLGTQRWYPQYISAFLFSCKEIHTVIINERALIYTMRYA